MFGLGPLKAVCIGCLAQFPYRELVFYLGSGGGFKCPACRGPSPP